MAPGGSGWVHEIKYDGYRMHARIDGGDIKLLGFGTGLDWSHRYRRTIEALGFLKVKSAYLEAGGPARRPTEYGHSDGRIETKAMIVDLLVSKKAVVKVDCHHRADGAVAGNNAIARHTAA